MEFFFDNYSQTINFRHVKDFRILILLNRSLSRLCYFLYEKDFHLTPDKNKVLEDIASDFFKDRPFVYISHRKNSYSVDPSIYM